LNGTIQNGQSRETGNIGYTRRTQHVLNTTKRKANTNNVNKTWTILQTTGDKDEPNMVLMRKSLINCHILYISPNVKEFVHY